MPCATSFKHVSPTSAAVGKVLPEELKKACFVEDVEGLNENPLACAYVRARGTDRMCSFGDWVALSDICDELTASLIAHEVSDGVIAPGYTEKALQILKGKRKGSYNVVRIDPDYVPREEGIKEVFGIAFHQGRNNYRIDEALGKKLGGCCCVGTAYAGDAAHHVCLASTVYRAYRRRFGAANRACASESPE